MKPAAVFPAGKSFRSSGKNLLQSVVERSIAWTVGSIPAGVMHVCLICLCCQVEVSASSWSLVQRNPADCGVSECEFETSQKRPRTNMVVEPRG